MTAGFLRYTISDIRYTIFKVFLALFLFSLLSFLFLVKPSFAQTNEFSTTSQYISGQSPHAASLAIYNFSHALSCILIGQSPIAPCLEFRMYKDAQGMVKSVPYLSNTNTTNGVLGMSMSMIGEVISKPPIHSSLFIANLGEQIGIKSAHAQVGGSGSGVLAPIFKLWEVSRNISYLAMIVIFIGVGFMVMFRQKLNPQTVVSVQMALPGLIIGLVMITFSYFLASLISDMAFVGTNVVGYYFSLAQGPNAQITQLPLMDGTKEQNVLSIFSRYTRILSQGTIYEIIGSIWGDLRDPESWNFSDNPALNLIQNLFPPLHLIPGIRNLLIMDPQAALSVFSTMLAVQFVLPFGALAGGAGQIATGGIAAALNTYDSKILISLSLSFIAMLVLIYSMFKLLFRLLTNLLSIIFLTIAAPFYFLAASIPGRQSLVTNWVFNMLCNVLAFPAVFGVFYFVAFILGRGQPNTFFYIDNSVSLINRTTFPLLGGLESNYLNVLLAFAALVAAPSIPDIICKAVGKPSQLGALAAGAVGGAIRAGQRYGGQVQSGVTGFAQNAGNLRFSPGHVWDDTDNKWTTSRDPLRGARPGRIITMRTGLHDFNEWRKDPSGKKREETKKQGKPGSSEDSTTALT